MPEITNDEYHDILDAIKAAKQDFRYASDNNDGTTFEVEAYQITPRSRFEDREWPPWLQMQKSPTQVNRLYCEAGRPDDLALMMVGMIEQPLGATDWIVLYKNGDMTVVPERDFTHFYKVVPVPAAPVLPESAPGFEEQFELDENNKLIPRKTPLTVVPDLVEEVEVSVEDEDDLSELELETEVYDAIVLMKEEFYDSALEGLIAAMLARTKWCDCAPGSCSDATRLGCRQKSPLVK
jgi:hypothetical protein